MKNIFFRYTWKNKSLQIASSVLKEDIQQAGTLPDVRIYSKAMVLDRPRNTNGPIEQKKEFRISLMII